jgi:hypothetical protein
MPIAVSTNSYLLRDNMQELSKRYLLLKKEALLLSFTWSMQQLTLLSLWDNEWPD